MIDIQAIRAANHLPSIVAAQVRLQRSGNEWKGCCPFHPDRSPSFTIYKGGQRFQCFGCGAEGDVLDYVARLYRVGMVEAARVLCAGELPTIELPSLPVASRASRTVEAQAIWERAIPAAGTLAETYLASRRIFGPLPPDIRFSRLPYGKSSPLPCLVAAVRNLSGDVVGVQRVYLRNDGSRKANLPKTKLSLGKVAGGAIRLGDLDASGSVTVCEGPEDGLSLLETMGGPVWVAAGATFMPTMQFPPEIRSIIIGADNDEAGALAADKAAKAFVKRGLAVRIIRPLTGFKDWNDELRGVRS